MFKKKVFCYVFKLDSINFDEKKREEIFQMINLESKIELVDYVINFGSGETTFIFSQEKGERIQPTMYRVFAFSKNDIPDFKAKNKKIIFKETIIYKFNLEETF